MSDPATFTVNDACVIGTIVFVLITLVLFALVLWEKYNPKNEFWNRMNLFAAALIFMTLFSSIPQLYLVGRTYDECYLLHHWAGSFYFFTNDAVLIYFLARSNMVVQTANKQSRLGQWLLYIWAAFSVLNVIGLNVTMQVAVVPPQNVCVAILMTEFSIPFGMLIPTLFDIFINARFIYHIVRTSKDARATNSATRRLLVMTCLLCFINMIVAMLGGAFTAQILPLPDLSLLTPILTMTQAFSAALMAWPAILVRCSKGRAETATSGQAGSRQRATSSKPMLSGNRASITGPAKTAKPNNV